MRNELLLALLAGLDEKASINEMLVQLPEIAKKLSSKTNLQIRMRLDDKDLQIVRKQLEELRKEVGGGVNIATAQSAQQAGTSTGRIKREEQEQKRMKKVLIEKEQLLLAIQEKYKGLAVTTTQYIQNTETGYHAIAGQVTHANGIIEKFNVSIKEGADEGPLFGVERIYENIGKVVKDTSVQLKDYGKIVKDNASKQANHLPIEERLLNIRLQGQKADKETAASINRLQEAYKNGTISAQEFADKKEQLITQNKRFKQVVEETAASMQRGDSYATASEGLDRYKKGLIELHKLMDKKQKGLMTETEAQTIDERIRKLAEELQIYKAQADQVEETARKRQEFAKEQTQSRQAKTLSRQMQEEKKLMTELSDLYAKQAEAIQRAHKAKVQGKGDQEVKELALVQQQEQRIREINRLFEEQPKKLAGTRDALIKINELGDKKLENARRANEQYERMGRMEFRSQYGEAVQQTLSGQSTERVFEQGGFDTNNTKRIQEYIQQLHQGEVQLKNITQATGGMNDATHKLVVTTDHHKNRLRDITYTYNEQTGLLHKTGEAYRLNANRMLSWTDQIQIAIKRMAQWAVAGTLIYGTLRKIREGVSYISELDKELTQVAIIQQISRRDVQGLAQDYIALANSMSKTVEEISRVNTELIRQGLSIQEAGARMETILKLSSTGMITAEESLRIITTAVNAMQEGHEKAADVLLRASQISAVSVDQLGESFTKTASSAFAAGVSIEQTTAILSAMTEVTQEGPSQLGTSLKTILARFNAVNEETGAMNLELNKVQKAIESVGIDFTDAAGQIRNVYDILEDLSGTWQDLDKNTQAYIATTAAGVRMQNRFYAIMNNFNIVGRIHNDLLDSAGTLTEGYAVYLGSVEASSKRARAAMEQLWINTIDSEALTFVNDMVTNFTLLVDKVGALELGLTLVNMALLRTSSLVKGMIGAESLKAMAELIVKTKGLQTAALGTKIVGVGAHTPVDMITGNLIPNASAIDSSGKLITKSLTGVGLAAKNAGILFGGFVFALAKIAVFIAVAAAIAKVTKAIYDQATAARRATEAAQALSTEYMMFQRNLPDLQRDLQDKVGRLQEIDTSVAINYGGDLFNAPAALQSEYTQLRQEIGSLVPDYIDEFESLDDALAQGYHNIFDWLEKRANDMNAKVLAAVGDLEKDVKKKFEDMTKSQAQAEAGPAQTIMGMSPRALEMGSLITQEDLDKQAEEAAKAFNESLGGYINATIAAMENEPWYNQASRNAQRVTRGLIGSFVKLNAEEFKGDFDGLFAEVQRVFGDSIEGMDTAGLVSQIEKAEIAISDLIELSPEMDESAITVAVQEILDSIWDVLDDGDLTDDQKGLITRMLLGNKDPRTFAEQFSMINYSLRDMYEAGKQAGDGLQLIVQAQEQLNEQGYINSDLMISLLDEYGDMEELLGANTDRQLELLQAKLETHAIDNHTTIVKIQNEIAALEILIEQYNRAAAAATSWVQILMYEQLMSAAAEEVKQLNDNMQSFLEGSKAAQRSTQRAVSSGGAQFRAEYDRYLQIETLQRKINHEIEKRNLILADTTKTEEEHIQALEEKISLLKTEQSIIHTRAQESRKERAELESFLSRSGFLFSGEGDKRMIDNLSAITGKSQQVLDAYNRYIQLQTQEIPALGRQWMAHQNEMVAIARERHDKEIEMIKEQFEVRVEYIDKELEALQNAQDKAMDALDSLSAGFNLDEFQNQIKDISQSLSLLGGGGRVSSAISSANSQITGDLRRISGLNTQINELVQNQLATYRQIEDSAGQQFTEFDQVKQVITEIGMIIQQKIQLQEQLIKQEQRLQNQISQRQRQHKAIEAAMQREIERYQEWNQSISAPSFDMGQLQDAIAGIGIEFDLPVNLDSIDSSDLDADLSQIYNQLVNYANQMGGSLDSQLTMKQELLDLSLEIQDALRDTNLQYELQKKLIQDGIEAIERAEKIRFDNVNKMLDAELKKYNEIIDARLKLLDEESASEDFETKMLEEQQKAADIRNQIDALALDDSQGARSEHLRKIEELEAQERNMAQMQNQRTRDLRRENLENQRNYIAEYIDMLKLRNEDINLINLEQIEVMNLELEELDRVYAEQIAVLQLFAEQVNNISSDLNESINQNLEEKQRQLERERELNALEIQAMQIQLNAVSELKQHLINTIQASYAAQEQLWEAEKQRLALEEGEAVSAIEKRMEAMINAIKNGTLEMAQAVKAFNDQVAQLGAAMAQLNNLGGQGTKTPTRDVPPTPPPSTTSPPSKIKTGSPVEFTQGEQKADGAFLNGRWYNAQELERMFGMESGAYTGTFKGGRLGVFHEKELLLNKVDTSNILDAIKLQKDMFKSKIPTLAGASNVNNVTNRPMDIDIKIGTITGDAKGADLVINKLVRKIQKIGGE